MVRTGRCPNALRFVYGSIGIQKSSWENILGKPISHHARSFPHRLSFLSNRKRTPIVVVFVESLSYDFDSKVVRVWLLCGGFLRSILQPTT